MSDVPAVPDQVFVGRQGSSLYLALFATEKQALNWLGNASGMEKANRARRLYRATLKVLGEVQLVQPEPYLEEVVPDVDRP